MLRIPWNSGRSRCCEDYAGLVADGSGLVLRAVSVNVAEEVGEPGQENESPLVPVNDVYTQLGPFIRGSAGTMWNEWVDGVLPAAKHVAGKP